MNSVFLIMLSPFLWVLIPQHSPQVFETLKLNLEERKWTKWIDSFQPIDLWFITNADEIKNETIDMDSKMDKINKLEDKINKI